MVKTHHTYYPAVSVGQESRHGMAGPSVHSHRLYSRCRPGCNVIWRSICSKPDLTKGRICSSWLQKAWALEAAWHTDPPAQPLASPGPWEAFQLRVAKVETYIM